MLYCEKSLRMATVTIQLNESGSSDYVAFMGIERTLITGGIPR